MTDVATTLPEGHEFDEPQSRRVPTRAIGKVLDRSLHRVFICAKVWQADREILLSIGRSGRI
jgi:hypothetical protein